MEDKIKERELDEMFGVLLRMPEDRKANRAEIVKALYNAGYRKFEIVDEPEAPYDGGAAFGELKKGGISVRDYFAAAAGKEEVTEARDRHYEAHYGSVGFKPLSLEQAKYAYADAMLEARKK